MSHGNQSFLRFSLEESVWFQRGQEVEELVSISLDPNITIQEIDQYVTIRGSLDLKGEYKPQIVPAEQNNQDNVVQKWIQNVEERNEGICEFFHQFPVDITIPTNRVRDLSEIDVIIETFDYLLPERSCLRLSAELNISGLYGNEAVVYDETKEEVWDLSHRVQDDYGQEFEEEAEQNVETDNSDYESFEVEAKKEEKFFTEPTHLESSSYHPTIPELHFAAYRSNGANSQQDQGDQVEVEEEDEEEESSESPNMLEKLMKKKQSNKKSMSISEFLARKEGEEHAKLKVCIVQQGESVETLAERYDITVQQLLKVNYLELNQDVHEGQVLYIPQVVARK